MSEPARAAAAPTSIEDRRAERKPKSHRWTRWRRELPKHLDLGAVALELASELARRADNDTGECSGYQAGFAAAIGRSAKSVQRATAELVEAGLIVYKPGHHRPRHQRPEPCHFRLVPLEEGRSVCPQGAVTVSTPGCGQTGRDVRSACPGGAVSVSTLTAVGTAQGTGPPNPRERGSSDSVTIEESYVTDHGRARTRRVDLPSPSANDHGDWDQIRELLRGAVDENIFAVWFETLELIAVEPSGALVVSAGPRANWLRTRFRSILDQAPRELRLVGEVGAATDVRPVVDGSHDDVEQLELELSLPL